ncbi:MAG: hypothetical protein ACPGSI_18495, partial [Pikeienuella sp.]
MGRVVGDIAVVVGADVSGLEAGMRKAGKATKGFSRDADSMAKRMAKASVAITALGVAAGVGFLKAASSAAKAAKEIDNLSKLSGVGAVEFQRLAVAGETVGFSQEKMADIFKDVNDKVGDFLANGAGPLKDFFENIAPQVGVTADQFAKLSGPEALQLYVDSLERAGVSQQQMTFYMEALANDATALVPLLKNNGREMKALGDAAESTGRIIDQRLIDEGVKLDRKLQEISDTISTKAKKAMLEYADEIVAAADFIIDDLIPALADFGAAVGEFVEDIQPGIDALVKFISLAKSAAGIDGSSVAAPSTEDAARFRGDVDAANDLGGGDPSNTGLFYVDENGNVVPFGTSTPTPEIPSITAPRKEPRFKPKPKKKRGGGGSKGPDADDLEALQQQLMTQSELVDAWRLEQLEKLREFRDAKLTTEEEFNELEAKINKEHQDRLLGIALMGQGAHLSAVLEGGSQVLGALGAFNEKAFKSAQVFAAAQALVSTFQGSAEALKLPFPGNLAAAAAV